MTTNELPSVLLLCFVSLALTTHPFHLCPLCFFFFFIARFVRKLSEEDVAEVEAEAERRSKLGELHADEFNPHGQAYVQAEEA